MIRPILLAAITLVAAGCSGSTDPATATLFDNIHNLQTGEYDRQIAAKDAEASALVRANQASQARITKLEGQSRANSAAIASLKSQIAAARAQAATARQQVAGDPGRTAQLRRLEGQIDAVQADVDAGMDPSVARAELGRVSAAIRALAG